MNEIKCKEYYINKCDYGHAIKCKPESSKFFCEYGLNCKFNQSGTCRRKHIYDGNINELKCPFESGIGYCTNRNFCPYFHDGNGSNNAKAKWSSNQSSYGHYPLSNDDQIEGIPSINKQKQ